MGWTIFLLAVSGLYDLYAVQLALRNGRHPAPIVYGFYVPSAEMMTAMMIFQANSQNLPVLSNTWAFAIALVLFPVALITLLVAGRAYRRSIARP